MYRACVACSLDSHVYQCFVVCVAVVEIAGGGSMCFCYILLTSGSLQTAVFECGIGSGE